MVGRLERACETGGCSASTWPRHIAAMRDFRETRSGSRSRPVRRWLAAVSGVAFASSGCQDTASGGLDLDAVPALTLVEQTRIGSVDDPDVGFSRVYSADVDADGRLYVFEGADMQIRVYDTDGGIVRRIGGRGAGPGEFEGPPRWGVVGDTIWAYDFGTRRMTLFGTDGTLVSAVRNDGLSIPLPGCLGYVMPWSMRSDGLFTGEFMAIACGRETQSTGVEEGDSIPVPRVVFDASGAIVDTIGWDASPPPRMVPPPEYDSPRFQFTTVGSRRLMVPDPPTELPIWIPRPDGRIVVEMPLAKDAAAGYVIITRFGLEGDTVFRREYRYDPVAWTDADLDALAARASTGAGTFSASPAGGSQGAQEPDPAAQRALRAAMSFPEHRLPLINAEQDADGRLWLGRDEPEGSTTRRWVMLDADAMPIGVLELPVRSRMLWSSGDFAWIEVSDELDVPWLVRYRIQAAPD